MKRIKLTQGQFAIVDDSDYARLSEHKWYATFYKRRGCYSATRTVGTGKNKRTVLMHREVVQTPVGMETDHINGNTLDNRRANLRICAKAQNGWNKSKRRDNTTGFKGVFRSNRPGRWRAQIRASGAVKHLGYFSSKIGAALAYNAAAVELHGEFANLNEIPSRGSQ